MATDGKYRTTDVCNIEVLHTDLGEITTRDIATSLHPQGFKENLKVTHIGGKSYEKATKRSAISKSECFKLSVYR